MQLRIRTIIFLILTALLAVACTPPVEKSESASDQASASGSVVAQQQSVLVQPPRAAPNPALAALPQTKFGDGVDWVKALQTKAIDPKADVSGEKQQMTMDLDIVIPVKATLNHVSFSHKIHTEWLSCNNCHTEIFQMQKGATPIRMVKILQGETCGVCHGSVAFPITDCNRCHSIPRDDS